MVLWKAKLFLEFLKNVIVGVALIGRPSPWFLLLFFEVLDLPEGSLHIHDIG